MTPCEAAPASDGFDLELQKRLLSNLGLERIWPADLDEAFDRLAVRMLEVPDTGEGPESVVSVYLLNDSRKGPSGGAEVRVVEALEGIRTSNLVRGRYWKVKKRPRVVEVRQRHVQFPRELAERLAIVFSAAVLDSGYRDIRGSTIAIHGTSFQFLTSEATMAGRVCAEVYHPQAGSPTAALVRIGQTLRDFAWSPREERAAIEAELERLVGEAEKFFTASEEAESE